MELMALLKKLYLVYSSRNFVDRIQGGVFVQGNTINFGTNAIRGYQLYSFDFHIPPIISYFHFYQ